MSPEAEKALKGIEAQLSQEQDPEKRELLQAHRQRFLELRKLEQKRAQKEPGKP